MRKTLLLSILLLCRPCPCAASNLLEEPPQASSPAISGTVLDPSGTFVPHARVLLQPSGDAAPQDTTTDSSGVFRFEQLSAGLYRVTVQAPGFRDETLQIKLSANAKHISPLRITLSLASQLETLTVGGDDSSPQVSTEISQNQSANSFDRSALDRVPVFDQDYVTTLSRFLDDNTVATSGVSLVVNGIEANGPGVPPSAVQEVKINQNPYSALFANPGRATARPFFAAASASSTTAPVRAPSPTCSISTACICSASSSPILRTP